jgi:uncharacterized membrane protein
MTCIAAALAICGAITLALFLYGYSKLSGF